MPNITGFTYRSKMIIAVILLLLASSSAISWALLGDKLHAQTEHEAAEVRINAFIHENGRIEFGLQQRQGDEWGERLLPRSRFLGQSSPTGRWLSSTPISITQTEPQIQLPIRANVRYLTDDITQDGTVMFITGDFRDFGPFETRVMLIGTAGGTGRSLTGATLTIACVTSHSAWSEAGRTVVPARITGWLTLWEEKRDGSIESEAYDLDGRITVFASGYEGRVDSGYGDSPLGTYVENNWTFRLGDNWLNSELMDTLKEMDTIKATVHDLRGREVAASFSNRGWLETPVQPNLDYCGDY